MPVPPVDPITTAIAVGVPLLGGLLGNNAASGDRSRANALLEEVLKDYQGIQTPDIEKLKLYLEEYQQGAAYNPEQEGLVGLQGGTELSGITLDPRLRGTQMDSLAAMEDLAKTGMSAIDRAQMEEMLQRSNAENQAQQKSILQNRAARGMSGSGDELAAALSASQSGANRTSSEALKIAADAMNRRMGATTQAADLARSIENSDYARKSNEAIAKDNIAASNARLRQQVEGTNVAARNEAQQYNQANQQKINNANVDLRNSQQQHNKNLIQQEYDNKLKKMNAAAGAANNLSGNLQNNANATANMYNTIATGAGTVAAHMMKQDDKNKKQVT